MDPESFFSGTVGPAVCKKNTKKTDYHRAFQIRLQIFRVCGYTLESVSSMFLASR